MQKTVIIVEDQIFKSSHYEEQNGLEIFRPKIKEDHEFRI